MSLLKNKTAADFIKFVSALEKAQSLQELEVIFQELLKKLQMNTFGLVELSDADQFPKNNLVMGNIGKEYLTSYWEKGGVLKDMMVRDVLTLNAPGRMLTSARRAIASEQEAEILDLREKHGIYDGYMFPIKGRMNLSVLVAMHGDVSKWSRAHLAIMEMLCTCLYRRACELFPLPNETPSDRKLMLTPRERECLVWVAKGKTNWEISQVLEITERTVQFHVENARHKLGAETRLQAVVVATEKLELFV